MRKRGKVGSGEVVGGVGARGVVVRWAVALIVPPPNSSTELTLKPSERGMVMRVLMSTIVTTKSHIEEKRSNGLNSFLKSWMGGGG